MAVVLRDISVVFPGTRALDGVTVHVEAGETHAIVGENGAGKSTLVKVLSGVQAPTSGAVEINGRPVAFSGPSGALAVGIALVSQEGSLVPSLSGAENIFLGHERRRAGLVIDQADLRRRANALRQQYFPDTTINLDCPVQELPHATQKVIEILRALSRAAKVLILDEPTASLPARDREQLTRIIRKLAQGGLALVLISHFLGEVLDLADRITVLRDGRRIATLGRGEAREEDLVELMLSRSLTKVERERRPSPTPAAANGHQPSPRLAVTGWSGPGFGPVDLSLQAGEILGLIGLSGAGQVAFVESLYGAVSTKAGRLELDGRAQKVPTPRAARAAGIGLVPDTRMTKALVASWTVRENLSGLHLRQGTAIINALPLISSWRERQAATQQMRRLQIKAHSPDQLVGELSGGNKQKVSIGRWLFGREEAGPPAYRVMIFVEPTEGVDVGVKAEIHRLIRNLANSGVGVLVVSADLLEIEALADRVAAFGAGRVTGFLEQPDFSEAAFVRQMSV